MKPWVILDAADFTLDGGAMNGVVDRAIWEGKQGWKANPSHMVPLKNNLPLIQTDKRVILIDSGVGACWPDKKRSIHSIDEHLELTLGQHGIHREQVTDIVFTHLHWDHAGGVIRPKNSQEPFGDFEEAFPNAHYYIQEAQWDNARDPHMAEAGSYRGPLEIKILEAAKQNKRLHLVKDADIVLDHAGMQVEVVETGDGHSVGHQMILYHFGEGVQHQTCAYFGDLIPTTHHLSLVHGMGYDLDRRLTASWKQKLLDRAIDEKWLCYFDHDLEHQGVRIQKGAKPGSYNFT